MKVDVLIIANTQGMNVKSYLIDQGTLNVIGDYTSFEEANASLGNMILSVNKTLYLYNPIVHNIRKEMSVLSEMMASTLFFNPGEILFVNMSQDSENQDDRYFKTVMQQYEYDNYQIAASNTVRNLSDLYQLLIGSTKDAEIHNTIRNVYRVNRKIKAKRAYEADHIPDGVVGLESSKTQQQYEQTKKSVAQTESRFVNLDSKADEIEKLDNVYVSEITLSAIANRRNTYLLVGNAKTGRSIWAASLAFSATQQQNSTILLDFTRTTDASLLYDANGARYTTVTIKDLLQLNQRPASNLYVLGSTSTIDLLLFLQWFYVETFSLFDSVFLCVDSSQLESVLRLIAQSTYRVLHCIDALQSEIPALERQLSIVGDDIESYVLLNDFFQLPKFKKFLTAKEVKQQIGERAKIVGSCFLEDLAEAVDIISDIG